MAIQYAYTSLQGVVASSAYHRITRVDYNADNTVNAKMTIKVFKDANARSDGFDPLDINVVTFTMDVSGRGAIPLTQAYNALKTKTAVIDPKGRSKNIDYTHDDVRDV